MPCYLLTCLTAMSQDYQTTARKLQAKTGRAWTMTMTTHAMSCVEQRCNECLTVIEKGEGREFRVRI